MTGKTTMGEGAPAIFVSLAPGGGITRSSAPGPQPGRAREPPNGLLHALPEKVRFFRGFDKRLINKFGMAIEKADAALLFVPRFRA